MSFVHKEQNLSQRKITDLGLFTEEQTKYRGIQKLDLSGNKLRSQPKSLAFFKELVYLDLSNNPIHNIYQIIDGLMSLPKQQDLKIDFYPKTEERDINLIFNSLNKLRSLNGMNVVELKNSRLKGDKALKDNQHNASYILKKDDMEEFKVLIECVNTLYREKKDNCAQVIEEEFTDALKKHQYDLGTQIKPNMNITSIQALNLRAKSKFYQFSMHKIMNYIGKYVDKRLEMIQQLIYNAFSGVYEGMNDLLQSSLESAAKLQKEKKSSKGFTGPVLENLNFSESDIKFMNDESSVNPSFSGIIKEGIDESNKFQASPGSKERSRENSFSYNRSFNRTDGAELRQDDAKFKVLAEKQLSQPKLRMMTLSQLRDQLKEIYSQKLKVDQKCLVSKKPRKTLEQHLQDILKTKFGLKSQIFESMFSLLMSLKYYQEKDNDIAVFQYILRNECDEEFRFSQNQVRKTLKELLRIFIYEYHPNSQQSQIVQILDKKVNGYISMKESTEIVNYLYNNQDADEILARMDYVTYVDSETTLTTRKEIYMHEERERKKKIKYKMFEKTVLDYCQLSHLEYLRGFTLQFRSVNKEQNGILTEKEFRDLIHRIDPEGELNLNIEQLLIHVDPFTNDAISYSSCVTIQSNIIIDEKNQQTLLHNINTKSM